MKHYYKLMAISLFVTISNFSCHSALDGPASASMVTTKVVPSIANMLAKAHSPSPGTKGKTVWICQSAASKRYHYNADCRGLKRCTHSILKTTIERAKAVGLTVCGYEN